MKKPEVVKLMLKNKERFSHIKMNTKTRAPRAAPVKKAEPAKKKNVNPLVAEMKAVVKKIGSRDIYVSGDELVQDYYDDVSPLRQKITLKLIKQIKSRHLGVGTPEKSPDRIVPPRATLKKE